LSAQNFLGYFAQRKLRFFLPQLLLRFLITFFIALLALRWHLHILLLDASQLVGIIAARFPQPFFQQLLLLLHNYRIGATITSVATLLGTGTIGFGLDALLQLHLPYFGAAAAFKRFIGVSRKRQQNGHR
jgi:hypothetical protein